VGLALTVPCGSKSDHGNEENPGPRARTQMAGETLSERGEEP